MVETSVKVCPPGGEGADSVKNPCIQIADQSMSRENGTKPGQVKQTLSTWPLWRFNFQSPTIVESYVSPNENVGQSNRLGVSVYFAFLQGPRAFVPWVVEERCLTTYSYICAPRYWDANFTAPAFRIAYIYSKDWTFCYSDKTTYQLVFSCPALRLWRGAQVAAWQQSLYKYLCHHAGVHPTVLCRYSVVPSSLTNTHTLYL
jgi:hypothetical protein